MLMLRQIYNRICNKTNNFRLPRTTMSREQAASMPHSTSLAHRVCMVGASPANHKSVILGNWHRVACLKMNNNSQKSNSQQSLFHLRTHPKRSHLSLHTRSPVPAWSKTHMHTQACSSNKLLKNSNNYQSWAMFLSNPHKKVVSFNSYKKLAICNFNKIKEWLNNLVPKITPYLSAKTTTSTRTRAPNQLLMKCSVTKYLPPIKTISLFTNRLIRD